MLRFIKSSNTKTWPSQYFEAPIPIVGIEIFSVISLAVSVVTHSNNTAFAPSVSDSFAKSNKFFFYLLVFPKTLILLKFL